MAVASITFLGTGTSVGVPVIGCECAVCHSADLKDKRLRSSVIYRAGDLALLVDSGPDLRQQALREGLKKIDAVLYTHSHLDHVSGFDDLRAFCWHRDRPLPMYATGKCLADLRKMYGWAFSPENQQLGYVKPGPVVLDGTFSIGEVEITPLPVIHGSVETVGYLFRCPGAKSLAYFSDVKEIPASTMDRIRGVDVMVVDALRDAPHATHFTTAEALACLREARAAEGWLTHLGHDNLHKALQARLPVGVRVAWDGHCVAL